MLCAPVGGSGAAALVKNPSWIRSECNPRRSHPRKKPRHCAKVPPARAEAESGLRYKICTKTQHSTSKLLKRKYGSPKTRFYNFLSQDSLMFLGAPRWIRTRRMVMGYF